MYYTQILHVSKVGPCRARTHRHTQKSALLIHGWVHKDISRGGGGEEGEKGKKKVCKWVLLCSTAIDEKKTTKDVYKYSRTSVYAVKWSRVLKYTASMYYFITSIHLSSWMY